MFKELIDLLNIIGFVELETRTYTNDFNVTLYKEEYFYRSYRFMYTKSNFNEEKFFINDYDSKTIYYDYEYLFLEPPSNNFEVKETILNDLKNIFYRELRKEKIEKILK